MKIIITGSLGHISKPLTEMLIKQGHEVTVISSKANKQKEIEALRARAAIGRIEDAGFLENIFAGADAVYCMTPPNFSAADQMAYYRNSAASYARAITIAGVKRAVYLSSYGADQEKGTGIIRGSHIAESILNELKGVNITYLRPGYFYYNTFNFIDMIKRAGIIGTNYGGGDSLVMVSPVDIADAAAEELTDLSSANKVRYVASDDRTCNEIAKILGAAISRPDLKWVEFTDEQVEKSMEEHGIPPSIAACLVETGAATRKGLLRQDYDKHKPALGKVKFKEFAKEFAAAFNKQ